MLKKALLSALVLTSFFASSSYAEKADNPFFKPSERNPVAEVVDEGPMCSPEAAGEYERQISALEEENNILSLSAEEKDAKIAELEEAVAKAKKVDAQKFIGIVNDKAIFFDEINKVYIYKNKNDIDGELLK